MLKAPTCAEHTPREARRGSSGVRRCDSCNSACPLQRHGHDQDGRCLDNVGSTGTGPEPRACQSAANTKKRRRLPLLFRRRIHADRTDNMWSTLQSALLLAPLALSAPTADKRDVDTRFPYTGPAVPIGDWVDNTVNGNGKGFIRLVEAPAVKPASGSKPSNSINVISLAFIPNGMTVHYQTAFGLDDAPTVHYGKSANDLCYTATGYTTTYDRTPPCSIAMTTMCNQYFHNVLLHNLEPGTTYYYRIPASNGTTASSTLQFKTAPASDGGDAFTIAVLNDMGYSNAQGTHKYLSEAADGEISFAWHGMQFLQRPRGFLLTASLRWRHLVR